MSIQRRPDPTPAQIKQRAAKIRRGWTERTYRRRAGLSPEQEPWTPPVYVITQNRVGEIVAERLD